MCVKRQSRLSTTFWRTGTPRLLLPASTSMYRRPTSFKSAIISKRAFSSGVGSGQLSTRTVVQVVVAKSRSADAAK